MVSKYDNAGQSMGFYYDNFIYCIVVVKGLVTFIIQLTYGSKFKVDGDYYVAKLSFINQKF
jgi:RNase P/RNase MRP subunit p29